MGLCKFTADIFCFYLGFIVREMYASGLIGNHCFCILELLLF